MDFLAILFLQYTSRDRDSKRKENNSTDIPMGCAEHSFEGLGPTTFVALIDTLYVELVASFTP